MDAPGYLSPSVAAILDRPDLSATFHNILAPEVPVDPYPRIANQRQTAGNGGSIEGKLGAGGLFIMTALLVWFYFYTRGHQA